MEPIPLQEKRSPLDRKYSPFKQIKLFEGKSGAITPSLDLSIKSANMPETTEFGEGGLGSATFSVTGKLPITSSYQGRHGSQALSLISGGELFKPRHYKGPEYETSKSYITGGGTYGTSNVSQLFTQSEKDVFKSDLTTRPTTSKLFAGLDFSKTIGSRRAKTKFSASGGGALTTTAAHLKSEDAGVFGIRRLFDATSHFQGQNAGDQPAYSTTVGRGDTELFTGSTWSNVGASPGGTIGYTSSGQGIFFGGTGETTQSYYDLVEKYGISETKTDLGLKTYKEKEKSTSFKPYLSGGITREWGLRNPWSGILKASYGTKHAPSSGFSASIGLKGRKYSRTPGLSFEIGGSKRGTHLGISYMFGGKD